MRVHMFVVVMVLLCCNGVGWSADFEFEENNSTATANKLTSGTTMNALISTKDDVDIFYFNAAVGGLTLHFINTDPGDYIVDPNPTDEFDEDVCDTMYQVILYEEDPDSPGLLGTVRQQFLVEDTDASFELGVGIENNGTHYVYVLPGDCTLNAYDAVLTNDPYQLVPSFIPLDDITGGSQTESEPNNSTGEADELSNGREMNGLLSTSVDEDYYVYKPEAHGVASINFSYTPESDASCLLFWLNAFDTEGNTHLSGWTQADVSGASFTHGVVPGVTYYLSIGGPDIEGECAAYRPRQYKINATFSQNVSPSESDDDVDGVSNLWDQCPDTPANTPTDRYGCPDVRTAVIPLCGTQ